MPRERAFSASDDNTAKAVSAVVCLRDAVSAIDLDSHSPTPLAVVCSPAKSWSLSA